jgi:hypothetical protein
MIPRKWEWIRDQCVRHGLKDAAKLAGEIDAVLLEWYDVKHTRDWEVFCDDNKMEELADRDRFFFVVKAIKFCVACRVSNMFCCGCSFGKECGECTVHNSLYDRFFSEVVRGFPSELCIICQNGDE